jgi:hypothetical protein
MSALWTRSNSFPLADSHILVAASSPWREAVLSVFQGLGITPHLVETLPEAVHFLEFRQPEFLILSEQFSSRDDAPDPLLTHMQGLLTSQRREIFVVLVSRVAKTGDMLSAFSQSVNLIIHPEDIPNLTALITESWNFWRELYHVFTQTRIQLAEN